jgi:hypothetical protein
MSKKHAILVFGKTAFCIVGMTIFSGGAYGDETSFASPLAEIKVLLKNEREKQGTREESPGRINELRIRAACAGDEVERKGSAAQLKDSDARRQAHAIEMARKVGGERDDLWTRRIVE